MNDDPRHGTLNGYTNIPCREDCCRAAATRHHKQRMLERLRGIEVTTSAIGTQRRIQALFVTGWTGTKIAMAAGYNKESAKVRIGQILRADRITVATAEKFARAYDMLSVLEPTGNAQTIARTRNFARRNGWHPASAWLDIDDPADVPDIGDDGRMSPDEKLAEFEWLTSLGGSDDEALRQVGWTRDAMEKHLQRQKKEAA